MPSTRVTDLAVKLAEAWLDLREEYEELHADRRLIVTATYRSPEEQYRLYQVGRRQLADGSWVKDDDASTSIITNCDGYKVRSKHNSNPSAALDFCVIVAGKVSWDPREYAVVGALAQQRGVVWGGAWTSFPDAPHLELPTP